MIALAGPQILQEVPTDIKKTPIQKCLQKFFASNC